MGHVVAGVDANYRPQDPEFYRGIYAEKAFPHLRFETPTPSETEKTILTQQKLIEELRLQLKKQITYSEGLNERLQRLEQQRSRQILKFGETRRTIPGESKQHSVVDPELIEQIIREEVKKRLEQQQ
jgi:hypothetical protein